MTEDLELGDIRFTKTFDRSNLKFQSEPDYFTPISNGKYFPFPKEETNFGQEDITGRFVISLFMQLFSYDLLCYK